MIANQEEDSIPLQVPEHMAKVIVRFAQKRNLTYEQATMKLLGTMCGIIEHMEEEDVVGLALMKVDGAVSQIFY